MTIANLVIGIDYIVNLRIRITVLIHYDFLGPQLIIRVAFVCFHKSTLLLRTYLVFHGDCSINLSECTVLLIVRKLPFAHMLD